MSVDTAGTVLILSRSADEHAGEVAAKLRARGGQVVLFNPAQLPRQAHLVTDIESAQPARLLLRLGTEEIDLTSLSSIYLRRPQRPDFPDTPVGSFMRMETAEALEGMLGAVTCPWVPGRPDELQRADLKVEQLIEARKQGFEVPPTLITNSPREALAFHNRHGGRIISKALNSSAFTLLLPELARYTELVERRDLVSLGRVKNCPVVFQAYVPKRLELRVTIVGSRVFAAEIDSQRSRYSRVDWRRYDLNTTPYRQHQLPAEVATRCLALVQHFGLRYGAIDLILTPEGEYVFLELNPSGQFDWIEKLTGLPITDALADLLLEGAPRRAAA